MKYGANIPQWAVLLSGSAARFAFEIIRDGPATIAKSTGQADASEPRTGTWSKNSYFVDL